MPRCREVKDPKRAIGYARVSTDEQAREGVSLEAQRANIESWCRTHGYALEAVHSDAGISGQRTDTRPGLQAALASVCECGGALVVYSLSRASRSTLDLLGIASLLRDTGADLVSLTEQIDTTGACGKMIFGVLAVLSEFERDLIAERTKSSSKNNPVIWRVRRTPGSIGLASSVFSRPPL